MPQLGDEAGLFRYADEIVWIEETTIGMLPPDQCLRAGDLAVPESDDRLVMDHQLVCSDTGPKFSGHPGPLPHRIKDGGVEYPDNPLATCFRGIHGRIGVAHQRLGAVAVLSAPDADAGHRPDSCTRNDDGGAERFKRPVRHRPGLHIIGFREQEREFVSAESCHRVGRADHGLQPSRDFHEDTVAGSMAEAVVHVFECVQIQEDEGGRLATGSGRLDFLAHPLAEQGPVGQTCEVVRRRHPLKFHLRLAQHRGTFLNAFLQILVHHVQFFGEQVHAADHGVDGVACRRNFQTGRQVAGREPNNAVDQLVQARIADKLLHVNRRSAIGSPPVRR